MFVETITATREEWEQWNDRLGLLSDPPQALIASIAWDAGDGKVMGVNLWDSPEAIGEFFLSRVQPTLQQLGEPATKPARHGPPVAVYLRP